jgi:hypothetical protein
MAELDHNGSKVSADESPESIIYVWEVSVSEGEYDYYLVRGWGDMLEFVKSHMETMLEDMDQDELTKESRSVSVKLRQMPKHEYMEACENN